MRKLAFFVSALSVLAIGCEDLTGAGETVQYRVEPSQQLADLVENAPSDFTWDYFRQEMVISAQGLDDSVDVALHAVQVQDGEVLDGSIGGPVPVAGEKLAAGVRTGELAVPITDWSPGPPGDSWFSTAEYDVASWISPSEFYENSQDGVVSGMLEEYSFEPGQGVVVVYISSNPTPSDVRGVSPFAIVLSPSPQ